MYITMKVDIIIMIMGIIMKVDIMDMESIITT